MRGTTLTLIAILCAPPLVRADDWPQLFGPNRDGISKETGLVAKWGDKGPPLVWQKPDMMGNSSLG